MKIIKINSLTLYFLLVFFLCGYIKQGIIIFLIVLVHELGHVCAAQFYKYKVIDITIYPFGGITKLEKDINTPIKNELVIAIFGIVFQIILMLWVMFIPLTPYTKELVFKYNLSIMLFNILPIIPLDGSLILKSILNKFFSFKTSFYLYIINSVIMVMIYFISNYWFNLNNYLIITLFLYKIVMEIKNYKYVHNKFLLERYLKKYNFKNISTKEGNLDILRLDTYQYFKNKDKIVSEKEKLRERFDIYR